MLHRARFHQCCQINFFALFLQIFVQMVCWKFCFVFFYFTKGYTFLLLFYFRVMSMIDSKRGEWGETVSIYLFYLMAMIIIVSTMVATLSCSISKCEGKRGCLCSLSLSSVALCKYHSPKPLCGSLE